MTRRINLGIFAILAAIFFVLPNLYTASGVEDEWVSKADMPTARGYLGVATVNGKIYAIGGSGPIGTNEEYDPQNDTWTTKSLMPNPKQGFAIAVCQNKIYCIGGQDAVGNRATTQVYDPATDTWETKASMPTARFGATAQVVDGKIYVIGGATIVKNTGVSTTLNVTEFYDPTTNTWTTKADMLYPTAYASAVIDNKIYVIGSDTSQVYDPATDTWSTCASPLSGLRFGAGGLANVATATTGEMAPKKIYVYDGTNMQVYNPYNDTWTTTDPPLTSREYLGVAVVNDLLYFIGGFKYAPPGFYYDYATNEQYTPLGYGTLPTPTESPTKVDEFSLVVPVALFVVAVVFVAVIVYLRHRRR